MTPDVVDVLPTTAIPLGWRADGTPIWAYSGADDADEGGEGGEGENEDDDDEGGEGGDVQLSAAQQKVVDAERAATRAARAGLKPFTRLLRDYGVKDAEGLRELLQNAQGKKVQDDEAARKEREAVLTKANKRIVSAEIRAQAAKTFADEEDALGFLDLDDYEVDEDGNVNKSAIERDLKDLLRRKPHLAKKGREPGFEPGARKTPEGQTDMSARIRQLAGRGRR